MLDFARNCVETERFDTTTPYFAIDVLERLESQELKPGESLLQVKDARAVLARFLALRAQFRAARPDVAMYEDDGSYRANLVRLLQSCEMWSEAAAVVRAADENIRWTRLRGGCRPGRYLAFRLAAAAGELRERVADFDARLRRPCGESCTAETVQALAREWDELRPQLEEPEGEYARHVATLLAQQAAFVRGDWVELPFDDHLRGWEPYCDHWSRISEHEVILSGRHGAAAQVCLRPLANFHPPLDIQAELEFLDPEPYPPHAGIGWSREGLAVLQERSETLPLFGFSAMSAHRLRDYPPRSETAWVRLSLAAPTEVYRLPTFGPHRLQLRLWRSAAEYQIDATALEAALPQGLHPDGWLSFGDNVPAPPGVQRNRNGGALRWRGLRVRRLGFDAPPDGAVPWDDRVSYWERRLEHEPADLVAAARLCALYYEGGRADDVVRLASAALERSPGALRIRKWLAFVLFERRDYAGAVAELERADAETGEDLDLRARWAEILSAAPLPSLHRSRLALSMAAQANERSKNLHARTLAALAAAHARLGEFEQATERQRQALKLADEPVEAEWEQRLAAYQARRPWQLPAGGDPESTPAAP